MKKYKYYSEYDNEEDLPTWLYFIALGFILLFICFLTVCTFIASGYDWLKDQFISLKRGIND